ncbi:sigma-70 family RNA polymerase sigma factor [Desulfohalobiaceae bacterium Ax17]|uniref:RNA polymerase sigma factor n=1 Tax=Desulfovulcanus ferrireducens TaxID=2831190 RepID=UPI00207B9E06|nr:sigma-70 family RNA polymerase sigma factor [Desulfovulcanus ferrireducens]MBT8763982.1 sigma-70 family RNA polymerase sigma factor [Desulfovulcanus ferrireducens]
MDASDEQRIINRVLKGDTNAFGILVKRYQKPIFNLMYRMSGSLDEAAELTQEAFIKAYEKLEHFQPGKKFFPWLYAVGINHAKDLIRKNKRHLYSEENSEKLPELSHLSDQQDSMNDSLDFQQIEKALVGMPLKYREAIILRYREEMSMRDIAQALQISVSAAKMRVSRGLEMLRRSLKGGGG